jgi:hypothetical protein
MTISVFTFVGVLLFTLYRFGKDVTEYENDAMVQEEAKRCFEEDFNNGGQDIDYHLMSTRGIRFQKTEDGKVKVTPQSRLCDTSMC